MNQLSRRNMLKQSGTLGTALLAESLLTQQPARAAESPARKFKVVVTGGHPGDPECGCGGLIARYTDLAYEVVMLYLNTGDPSEKAAGQGSAVRVEEAKKACAILKSSPLFAGQIDGHAVVDAAHYETFLNLLKAEKPDVVFTHWPIDNHRDHRAMSLLVHDAWLAMKRSFSLYYYEVSNGEDTVQFAPTHYVDITATEERKRQACFAHASQQPEKFYALQSQVTAMRGVERGVRHAEGYIRHVQSPDFALPQLP